jgi:hypothetical protein
MTPNLIAVADWHKSSYSDGAGHDCVEVADLTHTPHHGIAIRDSKHPSGPALLVTPGGWTAFLTAVSHGNLPTP